MSVGPEFKAPITGECGACGEKYKKGQIIRKWDEAICHSKCVPDDAGATELTPTETVTVLRGHENRPIAVPADVVALTERPYRAYQQHLAGHSWEMIALVENYPDAKAAAADVKRYVDEGASLIRDNTRQRLLELEVSRLDALQASFWETATGGNVTHANFVLSCILSRSKLLQLDKMIADPEQSEGTGGAVVIPSDEDGYSKGLEIAAG